MRAESLLFIELDILMLVLISRKDFDGFDGEIFVSWVVWKLKGQLGLQWARDRI